MPQRFEIELLRSLGIPTDRVRKAVITLEHNCITTVEITQYLVPPEGEALSEVMKRYWVQATLVEEQKVECRKED